MRTLVGRIKGHIFAVVFILFTLITTFYWCLPEKAAYTVLKLPYILLFLLGVLTLRKMVKREYRLEGLSKLLFILFIALAGIYCFVFAWRWIHSGFAYARYSLYLAMASLFGALMYFAVDSGVVDKKEQTGDMLFLSSVLLVMQLVIGAFSPAGVRGSYLLENIMVFGCVVNAFVPQYFLIMFRSEDKKQRITAQVDLVIGMVLLLISGSRSGVWVSLLVFFGCAAVLCFKQRKYWKNCCIILLVIVLLLGLFYALDLYNARYSISRVAGWSYSQGQEILEEEENDPHTDRFLQGAKEVEASDNMRFTLWRMAADEIRKSPLVGTGVVYFDCEYGDLVLQQAPHNIILETWMVYGGFGAVVFAVILASLLLYLLVRLRRSPVVFWDMASLASILFLAMFQPLMSMVYVTTLFWTIAGWSKKDAQRLSQGSKEDLAADCVEER